MRRLLAPSMTPTHRTRTREIADAGVHCRLGTLAPKALGASHEGGVFLVSAARSSRVTTPGVACIFLPCLAQERGSPGPNSTDDDIHGPILSGSAELEGVLSKESPQAPTYVPRPAVHKWKRQGGSFVQKSHPFRRRDSLHRPQGTNMCRDDDASIDRRSKYTQSPTVYWVIGDPVAVSRMTE